MAVKKKDPTDLPADFAGYVLWSPKRKKYARFQQDPEADLLSPALPGWTSELRLAYSGGNSDHLVNMARTHFAGEALEVYLRYYVRDETPEKKIRGKAK